MEPTNCPRCGKVFMKIIDSVCPACVKELDEKFEEVRAYVKEHPHRTIKEVSEACDVSVKSILRYIRDGKLEASAGIQSEITCSKCGIPIPSGRMCKKCASEVGMLVAEMKPKSDVMRMHTK